LALDGPPGHGADIDDPRSYDLMFNMADISIAEAVTLTASLLQLRQGQPQRTEQEADSLRLTVQSP